MADRRVKVTLHADVSEYTSALARAAAASRALGESADRSSQTVGTASDRAARKVAEVRQRLLELGRTIVSPDVKMDTSAARRELTRLQAELNGIDRSDASPRVDAETTAATAQLQAVQSQLNRLDGQRVTARVDVDDSGATQRAASNMQTLWATAAAVSPVVGAIGAAAVAGLGGITTLAGSSAAGLGVLALGFSGVSDAVKLLDQRQEAVAANAAKGAASQVSSARQIQAAQDSLSNARANAAASAISAQERVADAERNVNEARRDAAESVSSAQRRAAENVASAVRRQETAERSLGSAQRDVQRAQEDLTQARIDAAEEIEDLQLRVRGGVLAERQAVLDLAEAQRELNEIPADASAADREQMVLDLERAKLRVDELKESNGDLTVEQTEWARTGVEGSRQVQDAQERVADAQRGVEDAARAVGEAAAAVDRARVDGAAEVARAERDGAEKIANAQRQVASAVRAQSEQQRQSAASVEAAQRAVEAAMQSVGTTGVAALATVDAKLAEVGPSTMRFASFWTDSVQPALDRIRDTAAAGLLPGVQEGIESLLAQEPRITRFVDTYANSLGNLTRDSLANLSNPQWQRFWDMLETQGVPQLESMWRSGDNVAESLANIMVAFAPLATDMGAGIEDLTERFANWSADLSESEGFHEFEAYVRDNWPYIREIIANVADTIGDLLEAGAPIGSAYLQGFMLLTDVLSGLPVGVVQALLTAFLGYKAVQSVVGIVSGIANSMLALRTNVTDLPGKVTALTGSLSGGAASAQRFGGFLDGAAGSGGRMSGALGGVTSALGGPWGVALTVAGAALAIFSGQQAQAQANVDAMTETLKTGGAAAADLRAQYQEALDSGFWSRVFDDMNPFDGSDKNGLIEGYGKASEAAGAYWRSLTPLEQATQKAAEWSDTYNQRLNDGNATSEETRIAKERLVYWTGEETRMQGEVAAATEVATDKIAAQRTTYENMVGSATTQLGIYNQLLQDKATKEAESAASTEGSMGSATASWQTHVDNVDVSLDEYAARLDEDVANKNAWREDIKAVTERGGVEVGAALLAMGEEGKRLADDMANATDEDFRRMADAMVNHARNGGAQAAWEMDQAMKIMTEVSRIGGKNTADEIARTLGIGAADVARIANDYGINLAGGINPVLTAIGKPSIQTGSFQSGVGRVVRQADGGVMDFYANGGVAENHVAQIAPAGTWRVWAEEETGGEAYIPLAPSKRRRSMDIWEETGKRLGVDMQYFASGGQIFNVTRTVFPRAKLNSAYRPGDPGFHGRNQAADLGEAGFSGGAGRPYIANMSRWWTDNYGKTASEIIYNGLGDDRMNIKNGAPLAYSAAVQAQHRNHLHVAYAGTLAGATGGPSGVATTAAVPAPVRAIMPPVPAFPHNAIAGSAVQTSTHARDAAQAVADQAYATAVANAAAANAASGAFTPVAATGPVQDIVRAAVASRGWSASPQWDALARLIQKESSWNPNAQNPTSTAYGLFQFLNSTWAGTGIAKTSNPALQAEAGARYIASRYKTPSAALAFHNANNWYDDGGVATGRGVMLKNVIAPERTLSPRQTDAFEQMVAREFSGASAGAGGGGWNGQLPPIEVQARVFVGDREITDIVRVEANAVVAQRDAQVARQWRSAQR